MSATQVSLFESSAVPSHGFDPTDYGIRYFPGLLSPTAADRLLAELLVTTHWRQQTMLMWGKQVDVPRLTAWHGNLRANYAYSNLKLQRHAWTPALLEIKQAVSKHTREQFNSVLLNLYRDGNDSIAWHADDETELGRQPTIASVSLGAQRKFQLRHNATRQRADLELEHGSLVIMSGLSQSALQHQIPKSKRIATSRINLTFRVIK